MKPWADMASRERDALVAEKIFGVGVKQLVNEGDELDWYEEIGDRDIYSYSPVRPYSTDMSTAWEIVKKFHDKGLSIDIQSVEDFYRVSVYGSGVVPRDVEVFRSSAPEAICLAALRALRCNLADGDA